MIYHNGDLVNDSRVVTEVKTVYIIIGNFFLFNEILQFADKVITLRIENVLRSDRGEWLAKLENVLGEDCASVLITITGEFAFTLLSLLNKMNVEDNFGMK